MRLHLGFEEVQLGEALLFHHLFGLTLNTKVIDRDTKDEAHHEDEQAGAGKIKDLLPVKWLGHLRVELVMHGDGHASPGDRDNEYGYRGDYYIRNRPAFQIEPWEQEGDIPVNDQGIGDGIHNGIRGRQANTFLQVGEKGKQQYKGPDEEL